MEATGDPRWVPYLVDLIRAGPSTKSQNLAAEAAQELLGMDPLPVVPAYIELGAWVLDAEPDPGPEYTAFKSTLYATRDPDFAPLIESVDDRSLAAALQWGGVPVGGIRQLDDPRRLPNGDAEWSVPDELVLSVSVDGTNVGYPIRILGHHELANDTIAGRPVGMAYCPLCRSALAFDREVDGQVLTFLTSGMLLNSNKVMVDVETRSLWWQLTGEAIAGPLEGAKLTPYSVETLEWADWEAENPGADVVDIPDPWLQTTELGTFPQSYAYLPNSAYEDYAGTEAVWFPVRPTPHVFPLKADVATVAAASGPLAIEIEALDAEGPTVIEHGDELILAVPTSGGARLYDASSSDVQPGADLGDGDVDAGEESATIDGEELPRLESGQSTWFAWFGLHDDTQWWPR